MYNNCPRRFRYKYIDNLEEDFWPEEDNALMLGGCMDKGIEHGFDASLEWYNTMFPYSNFKKEMELFKIRYWVEKLYPVFKGGEFQIEINEPTFRGFADWYRDGWLCDFKYANPKSVDKYRESPQLHLYRFFLEKYGYEIDRLTYYIIPKVYIRQKKAESEKMFYNRLLETLESTEPILVDVDYNPDFIDGFYRDIKTLEQDTRFLPKPSKLCAYCTYKNVCDATKPLNIK